MDEGCLGNIDGRLDCVGIDLRAEGDVVAHRASEQECLLEDDVGSAIGHRDGPAIGRDEAGDEVQEGGLAGPGGADDGNCATGSDVGVDAGQDFALTVVGEVDVSQHHGVVRGTVKGARWVGLDGLVEQGANAPPPGEGVRQLGQGVADQPQGKDEEGEEVDEAGQFADRHRSGPDPVSAADQEEDVGHGRDPVEQ